MLRTIRIIFALLFFVGITLLFLDFTGVVSLYLGWMAKVQLLPAVMALNVGVIVALVVLTLLFGRFYCSVICPLGVTQDFFAWIGSRVKKNRYRYHKPLTWLRWVVFALFVVAMVVGLNAVAVLIAPYSSYGRMVSSIGQPVYIWLNNLLAGIAERHESYAFYSVEVKAVSAVTLVTASALLVIVAALSLWRGRLWCNTICPVGTLLGFVSRWSVMKPVIDKSKCVECGLCGKNCKAECIDTENRKIDYSRCVGCMDCIGKCHAGAIGYKVQSLKLKDNSEKVDSSRRKFLVATAAVGTAMALQAQEENIDGGLAVIEDKVMPNRKTPLKPAGARGLRRFSKRCTSCQLCVTECPSHLLRPSKELSTLMQPEMSFHDGYCSPGCVKCSQVCPAGAIEKISAEEKSAISIGHAVVVTQNCFSAQGDKCGHCAEVCPVGAVSMVTDPATGFEIPSVDENRCLGCGKCEYLCPSRPLSAIFVEGREQHINV